MPWSLPRLSSHQTPATQSGGCASAMMWSLPFAPHSPTAHETPHQQPAPNTAPDAGQGAQGALLFQPAAGAAWARDHADCPRLAGGPRLPRGRLFCSQRAGWVGEAARRSHPDGRPVFACLPACQRTKPWPCPCPCALQLVGRLPGSEESFHQDKVTGPKAFQMVRTTTSLAKHSTHQC